MLKYGIVSTASITKRFIEGLRLAGDEVVCIASRDINKAKEFALENNIAKYYGSYNEVYEDSDVDVVYIPVVNCLHFECAKDALIHKKHVVLEKPFTVSKKEAVELFEIAKDNNCFLFEGVKNVFVPSTKFVIDNIDKIGKIKHISTSQGLKKPFPEGHWMYDINYGGGAYFGSASYVFHYLKYIFNEKISNLDGEYLPSYASDMMCHFSFNIGDIKVDSVIDCRKDLDNTCMIEGEFGKIIVHEFWRSHYVEVILNDGNRFEFKDEGSEFVYEIKHIQECLSNGLLTSPIIKKEDSIEEVENICYLYKKWNLIK